MVKFENITIPAADLGYENPMPDIKNVSYIHAGFEMTDRICEDEKTYLGKGMIPTLLPYKLQDGYDRTKREMSFKAAVVENKHIRAVFLPELGGRLWSLYDKDEERELLYVNPVFQPGNLGLRNAWFSGGVEFNVGIKGHNPLTCSKLYAAVDKTSDGEVLRLYEFERIRGVVYSVSAWVSDESHTLFLRCRIENPDDRVKDMYWWSNIAVPETKGTRIIVPAEDSFLSFYNADHYILDKAQIPYNDGTDVSYPSNIPTSRDFFYKIPKDTHKWIASIDEDGMGLLQCSGNKLFGRKLFVWGMAQGGRHWNEWLSEKDSAYIEIQAGLAHTQLEHIPMGGHEVWEWVEGYTLLKGEKDILHGDYKAAVEYIDENLVNKVGDPNKLYFPPDDSIISSEIICEGSGWGNLEEIIRGEKISKTLRFTNDSDSNTDMWKLLCEKGIFPCPTPDKAPESYVVGKYWLEKLSKLPEKTWYSSLHIGVILYALYTKGEAQLEDVKNVFEESDRLCENPWAKRNLAMLYKNEYNDPDRAVEYILEAFGMKPDCRALVKETAEILTSFGKDIEWLKIFDSLIPELKDLGRLKLYKAIALIHLDRLNEASEILCKDFVMPDVKEGELSVSHYWFELYRRLYAKETGSKYDPENKELIKAADNKYPLPYELDFRMH